MRKIEPDSRTRYRTIWLSDIHLGYRGCKAEYLLDFLHSTEADTIFLVGDIVDIWSMKRTMYWPQSHNNIIRTLLGKAKNGTRIIFIPGNHDVQIRELAENTFGNIEIYEEYIHQTHEGKRILVLHGDVYDSIMQIGYLANIVGNFGYDFLLYLNRLTYKFRRMSGLSYWSLSSFIKDKVKNARKHVQKFEDIVARDVAQRKLDGVVCGHIHHPEMRELHGILYCNDGDWVENCTAIIENQDGSLELVRWTEQQTILRSNNVKPFTRPIAA